MIDTKIPNPCIGTTYCPVESDSPCPNSSFLTCPVLSDSQLTSLRELTSCIFGSLCSSHWRNWSPLTRVSMYTFIQACWDANGRHQQQAGQRAVLTPWGTITPLTNTRMWIAYFSYILPPINIGQHAAKIHGICGICLSSGSLLTDVYIAVGL